MKRDEYKLEGKPYRPYLAKEQSRRRSPKLRHKLMNPLLWLGVWMLTTGLAMITKNWVFSAISMVAAAAVFALLRIPRDPASWAAQVIMEALGAETPEEALEMLESRKRLRRVEKDAAA